MNPSSLRPASGSDTLDVVAGQIRVFSQRSENQLLSAALLLKEPKARIEAGEDARFHPFREWYRSNLPETSARDIRRLLEIVNLSDRKKEADRQRRPGKMRTRMLDQRSSVGDTWLPTKYRSLAVLNADNHLSPPKNYGRQSVDDAENIEQLLENWISFAEQHRSRIAELDRQYRATLVRRVELGGYPVQGDEAGRAETRSLVIHRPDKRVNHHKGVAPSEGKPDE